MNLQNTIFLPIVLTCASFAMEIYREPVRERPEEKPMREPEKLPVTEPEIMRPQEPYPDIRIDIPAQEPVEGHRIVTQMPPRQPEPQLTQPTTSSMRQTLGDLLQSLSARIDRFKTQLSSAFIRSWNSWNGNIKRAMQNLKENSRKIKQLFNLNDATEQDLLKKLADVKQNREKLFRFDADTFVKRIQQLVRTNATNKDFIEQGSLISFITKNYPSLSIETPEHANQFSSIQRTAQNIISLQDQLAQVQETYRKNRTALNSERIDTITRVIDGQYQQLADELRSWGSSLQKTAFDTSSDAYVAALEQTRNEFNKNIQQYNALITEGRQLQNQLDQLSGIR